MILYSDSYKGAGEEKFVSRNLYQVGCRIDSTEEERKDSLKSFLERGRETVARWGDI